MSRKSVNTSSEIRQLVIFNNAKGLSERKIAAILNIPKSTVHDILHRFKEENRIDSIPQKGKSKKLTNYYMRFVRREIEKNPKISAPKLCTALCERKNEKISVETINRAIKNMGYNSTITFY